MSQDRLFTIEGRGLTKRFNAYTVFKDLNFFIRTSSSLSLTGHNGSGKSTLMEVIAGIQRPSKGEVTYNLNGKKIPPSDVCNFFGFSSLKINPYSELTGIENIRFASNQSKRGGNLNSYALELLKRLSLYKDRDKYVKHYSSGMKHRLRFLLAVLYDPPILFLDEPGSNLDRAGKDEIYSYIVSAKKDKIIIIATNEEEEANLCDERIILGQ